MTTTALKLIEPTPETSCMLNIRQTMDGALYRVILSNFITLHQLHMLQLWMRFYVIVMEEDFEASVICFSVLTLYLSRETEENHEIRQGRLFPGYSFNVVVLLSCCTDLLGGLIFTICFKYNKYYVSGKIYIYTILIWAVEYGLSSSFLVFVCESSWIIYIWALNPLYSRFDRRIFAWRANLASELSTSLCWAQFTPHIYKFLW
jgi:hypothetical protein